MRRAIASVGLLGIAVVGLVAVPAAPAAAHTFTYSIESRGPITSDLDAFAVLADSTLNDTRGWSLQGQISYTRASTGGFALILATPEELAAAAPVCSETYSCRVGDDVLINEERWNEGTSTWSDDLHSYRHYVINHEVGHWLGLGHWECSSPGAAAPVMQQQSISLDGCEANTWPLAAEKEAAADNHGITFPPSSTSPFEAEIQWMLDEGISTGYADGRYHPGRAVTRQAMAAFIYRLAHDGGEPAACSEAAFSDVPATHSFCGVIRWMADEGLTRGHVDGSYRPRTTITRDETAAFLYRLFNEDQEAPACEVVPFVDVRPGHTFCGEVFWMLNNEISVGYEDATYRPDRAVSRGEMAAFLHRAVVEQGLVVAVS